MKPDNFDAKLETFMAGIKQISDQYMEQYPEQPKPTFVQMPGKVRTKIAVCGFSGKPESVYCFIDYTTGDVLKAASWNAPAKHARGNIFDENNGLKYMGPHGPAYLR